MSRLLIISALLVEVFASLIWFESSAQSELSGLGNYLIFHAAAAMLLLVGMKQWLDRRFDTHFAEMFLLFMFAFLIPFLGIVGLLLVMAFILEKPVPVEKANAEPMENQAPLVVKATQKVPVKKRSYSMLETLSYSGSVEKRLSVLYESSHFNDIESIRVFKQGLTDKHVEVRKKAYELMQFKDQQLLSNIFRLNSALRDSNDSRERLLIHTSLAEHFWERVYLGLVEEQERHFCLQKSLSHLNFALEHDPGNGSFLFKRGRVQLALEHYPAAENDFQSSLNGGVKLNAVLPYLAEVAFVQRRYTDTHHHLQRLNKVSSGLPERIHSVTDYWT